MHLGFYSYNEEVGETEFESRRAHKSFSVGMYNQSPVRTQSSSRPLQSTALLHQKWLRILKLERFPGLWSDPVGMHRSAVLASLGWVTEGQIAELTLEGFLESAVAETFQLVDHRAYNLKEDYTH